MNTMQYYVIICVLLIRVKVVIFKLAKNLSLGPSYLQICFMENNTLNLKNIKFLAI